MLSQCIIIIIVIVIIVLYYLLGELSSGMISYCYVFVVIIVSLPKDASDPRSVKNI